MSTIQTFNYSVNLLQTILWQYNNAKNLQGLIIAKQAWYDNNQSQFWTDWYTNVFNLQTANDFGLSVWAIILNLPLQIDIPPDPEGKPIFGFGSETDTPNGNQNFDNGSYSNNPVFNLRTEEKRLLLRLRYFQLISRGAIPEVNDFLSEIFAPVAPPGGKVYILDSLKMRIRVVFTFTPSNRLLFILKNYDLIPRDVGVSIDYVFLSQYRFGFGSETDTPNGNQNFDNGNYLPL